MYEYLHSAIINTMTTASSISLDIALVSVVKFHVAGLPCAAIYSSACQPGLLYSTLSGSLRRRALMTESKVWETLDLEA